MVSGLSSWTSSPVSGSNSLASWQNQTLNVDVNGDGFVAPLDALLVINYLNSTGAGMVPNASPAPGAGLVDVNGDKYVTAVDVLAVINHLNGN